MPALVFAPMVASPEVLWLVEPPALAPTPELEAPEELERPEVVEPPELPALLDPPVPPVPPVVQAALSG
jgi:hypothetical protein